MAEKKAYFTWEMADGIALVRFQFVQMLRFEAYAEMQAELSQIADTPALRGVVITLDAMDHFTSRMMGVLLSLSKTLRAKGGRMAVCRLRPEPLRAFKLCKLDAIIPVHSTEEEAREAVAKR